MHGLLCDTCHAPTSSSHLFVSLQVRTPPPPWLCQLEVFPHLLCKEDCVLGLRCWGNAGKSWGERDPLPGKQTSTCKNMFPFSEMCPGPWEGKFPDSAGMHRSPFPLAGNLLSMEGKGLQGERASPDLCRGGRNMLFRGGWGVGSRGPVISLLLPRYHPVLSGGQGSLYVNTSLPGSPGSGTGRRQRHEGTGFWGTNPRRNSSSRGTTCVQGGKNKNKKTSPCTWENTPS